jgi:hypothetical protein
MHHSPDVVIFASPSKNPRKRLRPGNCPTRNGGTSFHTVGPCLRKRIIREQYSPYSVRCSLCGAPEFKKCISASGERAPRPHAARVEQAAESYRERVRRTTDSKNLVKGEGVASRDARHPLFSLGSKVSGKDIPPRGNQRSAVSFRGCHEARSAFLFQRSARGGSPPAPRSQSTRPGRQQGRAAL